MGSNRSDRKLRKEAEREFRKASGRMNKLGAQAKAAARKGNAANLNPAIAKAEREARDWAKLLGKLR